MAVSEYPDFLGFPPPLLSEAPLRLPVLGHGEGWIALEKPVGTGMREHPWDAGIKDLDRALNAQLTDGKKELLRTGANRFASAYHLDPEIHGVALFATNPAAQDRLRNAVGSRLAEFRFLFVAATGDEAVTEEHHVCETPLIPHRSKAKMVPSSARGKRARTVFRRLADNGAGWTLWEASAALLRPHQVRAHAGLSGIPLPGDALYGGPSIPLRGEVRRGLRGPGAAEAVFAGPPILLEHLSIAPLDIFARAPAPGPFRAGLRQLGLLEAFEAACSPTRET